MISWGSTGKGQTLQKLLLVIFKGSPAFEKTWECHVLLFFFFFLF